MIFCHTEKLIPIEKGNKEKKSNEEKLIPKNMRSISKMK